MNRIWEWLKEKSGIIFSIGLAFSIASFVGKLQMGRDILHFLVVQLTAVHSLHEFVIAVAGVLHSALEWWRNNLRALLEFLPFNIPTWLHDPIAFAFFAFARAASNISRYVRHVLRTYKDPVGRSFLLRGFILRRLSGIPAFLAVMLLLLLGDKCYQFGSIDIWPWIKAEPVAAAIYIGVFLLFLIFSWLSRFTAANAMREMHQIARGLGWE